MIRIVCIPLLLFLFVSCDKSNSEAEVPFPTNFTQNSSVKRIGNLVRINFFIQKLQQQDVIRVGFIGGSITAGAGAQYLDYRFSRRLMDLLRKNYNNTFIEVNAGIGATTSEMGAYRAERDLLFDEVDIVFVDFSVNDSDYPHFAKTYEGLIRKILKSENNPAIICIENVTKTWGNVATQHSLVYEHYDLPVIAMMDTIKSLTSQADGAKWEDFYADYIHPNNRGHKLLANLLFDYLRVVDENSLLQIQDWSDLIQNRPEPLISDDFEYTAFLTPNNYKPKSVMGFKDVNNSSRFNYAWKGNKIGDKITFSIKSQNIALLILKNSNSGTIKIVIDNFKELFFNCYNESDYGYQTILNLPQLTDDVHLIEIEIVEVNNSNKADCSINAICLNGLKQI